MKKISFILFAILSISNFNFSQFAEIPQKSPEFVISKKDFTYEKILNLLFNGKLNTEYSAIAWKPYPKENVPVSDDGLVYTNVDSVLYYKNDTLNYALVVLRSIEHDEFGENSCAGCSPTEGMALFVEEKSSWKLLNFNRSVSKLGQGGFVPRKKIIQIGNNEFVFSLNGEELAGGGPIGEEYEYWFRLNESDFSEIVFNYFKAEVGEIVDDFVSIVERNVEIIKSDENEFYELKMDSKIIIYESELDENPKIKELPSENYNFNWVYDRFILKTK